MHIRARVTALSVRAVDSSVTGARDTSDRVATVTGAAGGFGEPMGSRALALGLATGSFSRYHSSGTPMARRGSSLPIEPAEPPRPQQSVTTRVATLRRDLVAASHRMFASMRLAPANPRVAAATAADEDQVHPAATPDFAADEGDGDGGARPDSRLPFECPPGAASTHAVDMSDDYTALSSVVSVRFEVEDDGCGMTPDQRASLFRPYAQVCTRGMPMYTRASDDPLHHPLGTFRSKRTASTAARASASTSRSSSSSRWVALSARSRTALAAARASGSRFHCVLCGGLGCNPRTDQQLWRWHR